MPIRFPCKFCNAKVKVPAGSEGRRLKCPACGQSQIVPREGSISDARIPKDAPKKSNARAQKSKRAATRQLVGANVASGEGDGGDDRGKGVTLINLRRESMADEAVNSRMTGEKHGSTIDRDPSDDSNVEMPSLFDDNADNAGNDDSDMFKLIDGATEAIDEATRPIEEVADLPSKGYRGVAKEESEKTSESSSGITDSASKDGAANDPDGDEEKPEIVIVAKEPPKPKRKRKGAKGGSRTAKKAKRGKSDSSEDSSDDLPQEEPAQVAKIEEPAEDVNQDENLEISSPLIINISPDDAALSIDSAEVGDAKSASDAEDETEQAEQSGDDSEKTLDETQDLPEGAATRCDAPTETDSSAEEAATEVIETPAPVEEAESIATEKAEEQEVDTDTNARVSASEQRSREESSAGESDAAGDEVADEENVGEAADDGIDPADKDLPSLVAQSVKPPPADLALEQATMAMEEALVDVERRSRRSGGSDSIAAESTLKISDGEVSESPANVELAKADEADVIKLRVSETMQPNAISMNALAPTGTDLVGIDPADSSYEIGTADAVEESNDGRSSDDEETTNAETSKEKVDSETRPVRDAADEWKTSLAAMVAGAQPIPSEMNDDAGVEPPRYLNLAISSALMRMSSILSIAIVYVLFTSADGPMTMKQILVMGLTAAITAIFCWGVGDGLEAIRDIARNTKRRDQ